MGDSTASHSGLYAVDGLAAAKSPPPTFVGEQNAGSLLRATWALYRSHFAPLFLGYVIPTFSVAVLQEIGSAYGTGWLLLSALLAGAVLAFFATSATTVTISDICLGNAPSLRRSYGKLFERRLWLNVLWTGLLQGMVVLLALLLVVPGLILMIKLMFTATIVVLERISGPRALKRSIALTKGHFWRLLRNVSLVITLLASAMAALMFAVTMAWMLWAGSDANGQPALFHSVFIAAFIHGVFYPLFFIAIILLYYDLRVRKEAYDVRILAEDMMR